MTTTKQGVGAPTGGNGGDGGGEAHARLLWNSHVGLAQMLELGSAGLGPHAADGRHMRRAHYAHHPCTVGLLCRLP